MAEVRKITKMFGDERIEIAIKVSGKNGMFYATLPDHVASILQVHKEIQADTFSKVESLLHDTAKNFTDCQTSEELLILIRYAANGDYNRMENKITPLFDNNTFRVNTFYDVETDNTIIFDWEIVIRETTGKKVVYYKAAKGDTHPVHANTRPDPNQFYKYGTFQKESSRFVKIPYTKEAEENLAMITEALRKASQKLFELCSMEPKKLTERLNLTPGNLLPEAGQWDVKGKSMFLYEENLELKPNHGQAEQTDNT